MMLINCLMALALALHPLSKSTGEMTIGFLLGQVPIHREIATIDKEKISLVVPDVVHLYLQNSSHSWKKTECKKLPHNICNNSLNNKLHIGNIKYLF